MVRYIKCPRCELNYIDADKQEYCDVCIAELKGSKLRFADLDDDDLEEIDAEIDDEQEELCPICGVNRIRNGEKMCESCKNQQEYEEEDDVDIEADEEWQNYIEEDDVGDLTVDEDLQKEIEEDFADDGDDDEFKDDEYKDDDDPLSDFDDDDFEDDEDDDDDFDDEDDDDDF